MPRINFVLAWKDRDYREKLTAKEREALPESPVGSLELVRGEDIERGTAVIKINGFEPIQFSVWSLISNCENISNAMSSTSTCCCFSTQ